MLNVEFNGKLLLYSFEKVFSIIKRSKAQSEIHKSVRQATLLEARKSIPLKSVLKRCVKFMHRFANPSLGLVFEHYLPFLFGCLLWDGFIRSLNDDEECVESV